MRDEATPAYLRALRHKHTVRVRGQILNAGLPDPRFGPVPLKADGTTVMTRSQMVRRRSTITVGDPAWIPQTPADPLAAYGLEMRLWYEVTATNLPTVAIPIITGHILSGQADTPFAGIPVTLVDRMWRPSEDEFPSKRTVRGSAVNAIQTLVTESLPWATFQVHPDIAANDIDMPPTVFDSRPTAIATLAASLGADSVHADAYGTICLLPVPDVADRAVWEVDAGPDGVLVKATRTWSSENAPNSVIARGTSTKGKTPQSKLVVDDDPTSPTYYGPVDGPPAPSLATGTYYPRQRKEWTGTMTTDGQCDVAARATLLQYKGQAKSIQFGTIGNPALEDGDPILVRLDPNGATEQHLLDSWTLQHNGSGMDGSSRAVTLNDAGGS